MEIRSYKIQDESAVIALWQACGLIRPWNDPHRDIARKLTEQPELFLVGIEGEQLIASAMAGFDGHRGWVYYLAVDPAFRQRSHGKTLMREIEHLLTARGCPKLSLMVRTGNSQVLDFYRSLGYVQDEVISLGRRLVADLPAPEQ